MTEIEKDLLNCLTLLVSQIERNRDKAIINCKFPITLKKAKIAIEKYSLKTK